MNSDLFSGISALGGGILGTLVPFLFVLTIVVFFHELGHFLVARLCGVKILTFSLGFGPELFGFHDRHGTRWKVSAFPLGGYVKFFGDENAASVPDHSVIANMTPAEREQSFVHQGLLARAAIVVAGPVANFLLAIAILAGLGMIYGKQTVIPRVDAIQTGSAAEAAGFKAGDVVISIDGKPIESFTDMQRIVSMSAGETLTIVVNREGQEVTLKAVPSLKEVKDNFGNVHRIGMLGISRSQMPEDVKKEPMSPVQALSYGARETWFVIDTTLSYIGGVFAGREAADQVGGIIGIAQASGQVASISFSALMHFAAVISISIGLLNLFPVPLLDGGHLLFYAIEGVRGKPLPERAQEYGFRIGLAIVVTLVIFATYNDVLRLVARWTAS